MKNFAFILLLSCLVSITVAQQPSKTDSLKRALITAKEDTNKVWALIYLSDSYQSTKPDSAVLFGQQALQLASGIHFPNGIAVSKHIIGNALWRISDYLEADKFLLEAIALYKSLQRWDDLLGAYAGISSNKRDAGMYRQALQYSFLGDSLDNTNKPCRMCGVFKVITGSVYVEMHMPDSAIHYMKQAPAWNYTLWLFGRAYEQKGNYEWAYRYYRQSFSGLKAGYNLKDLSSVCSSLAQLFKKDGQVDSCIYYAKKGYKAAEDGNYKKGMWEIGLLLAAIYEPIDGREALYYYKQAMAAKDRLFDIQKTTRLLNEQFSDQLRQQQEEGDKISNRNKVRMYILLIALGFFLLLAVILYRSNKQKQKAKQNIEKAYEQLKATQAQLIQSEKMASLGELTAGIAHEIQNPLNFVNNFSETNIELLSELKEEIDKGNIEEVKALAGDVIENNTKINHHGKRADSIVKGMLQHSRTSKGERQPTDINTLAEEYLRLAYHGFRAKDKTFNAVIETHFDDSIGKVNIIPQEIGRVLLNLFNNAFYAVADKKKQVAEDYDPTLSVGTKKLKDKIEIQVRDNGMGISKSIQDKIFQPFFTTKPTGEGTGLGLSLSYDIIKAHGGELKVDSLEGEGSSFIITIPIL